MTVEQREEVNLYASWQTSKLRKILIEYEGKSIEEVPEEYRNSISRLRELGITGKRKIKGQEIGKASYDATVEECDKADDVLNDLVTKKEKENDNGKK